MFKKRTLNKQSSSLNPTNPHNSNDVTTGFLKRPASKGIDLKKDIQEMESIIGNKKQLQPHIVLTTQKQQEEEMAQHSQFKTKKINKFTSHILNKLPQIKPLQNNQPIQPSIQPIYYPLSNTNPSPNPNLSNEIVRPILSNYGLLDKSHFKSGESNNIQVNKTKDHQQALMDYYVKKKIQEITKSNILSNEKSQGITSRVRQPEAWQQVLQIQKQYLTQEERIKEYSIEEIQKKIEKVAQDSIKSQMQKRAMYLKDLLESEHQRMEYASKKQLKIVKQDKERIERELNSKYRETGRRHFVESIKNSVL